MIYKSRVFSSRENLFQDSWRKIATYLLRVSGALGSSIYRLEGGLWVIISQWPTREIKEKAWPDNGDLTLLPMEIQEVAGELRTCIEESFDPIYLHHMETIGPNLQL